MEDWQMSASLKVFGAAGAFLVSLGATPADEAVDRTWRMLEDCFDSEQGGPWLRDMTMARFDRDKLKDIARMAFAWHGQTRRILQLSFKGITTGFGLGKLITSIGSGGLSETVNTCVTSITYDLMGGTTQLSTSFGELDFTN